MSEIHEYRYNIDLPENNKEVQNKEVMRGVTYNFDGISDLISSVTYITHNLTTICILTLVNSGYEVVGVGNCMDPDKYEEELGMDAAKSDAVQKLIEMEIYRTHFNQS